MTNKGKYFVIGIALLLIVVRSGAGTWPTRTANAQSGDSQTIVSPHKTFAFDAPTGWEVDFLDGPVITLSNGTTWLFFHGPYSFYGTNVSVPYELPSKLITEQITDEMRANGTLTDITIGGRMFARLDSSIEEYGPLVYLATILDNGDPVLIGAYLVDPGATAAFPDEDIATMLAIAATLRSVREPIPDTLESYADGWQAIVAELVDQGLVPGVGQLLFDIPDTYVGGTGLFARWLSDKNQAVHNMIIGATIDFQVPDDLYTIGNCILETRVDRETDNMGYQSGFVAFYLPSDGRLHIGSRADAGNVVDVYVDYSTFSGTQIDLVAYLIADRLTAYVNGQLVAHNILIPDQAGPFLIALDVQNETVRCDMHVWAYELP